MHRLRSLDRFLPGTALFFAVLGVPAASCAGADGVADKARVAAGAKLAQDTAKGNCLACHAIPSDPSAVTSANIGPPLVSMRARFPERDRLYRQVWDPVALNPDTVMPPFGKNHVLSGEEIELIIDYLYTQ